MALAQQRPEDEPSLDMKSAVSTAMNKLVTSLYCSLKAFLVDIVSSYSFSAAILGLVCTSAGRDARFGKGMQMHMGAVLPG